ncbi:MAG: NADH-quinone oxidoreductase subunit J [Armatimonadota bacterium]|nr:MAG: NADH-quinone oxidoreductase subunit J [Armatimonadota bacterium]
MTPTVELVLFVVTGATMLVSAVVVVASRNLVRAAFWLLPCFLAVAGLFLLLGAYFLAAIQVLVYAGAIMLLLLFVLMLTRDIGDGHAPAHNRQAGWAIIAAGLVAAVTIGIVSRYSWSLSTAEAPADTGAIGEALLRTYLLPFEVASVLLLAAIIGAIVIARSEPVA